MRPGRVSSCLPAACGNWVKNACCQAGRASSRADRSAPSTPRWITWMRHGSVSGIRAGCNRARYSTPRSPARPRHDAAVAIDAVQAMHRGDETRPRGRIHAAPGQPGDPCGHARTRMDDVDFVLQQELPQLADEQQRLERFFRRSARRNVRRRIQSAVRPAVRPPTSPAHDGHAPPAPGRLRACRVPPRRIPARAAVAGRSVFFVLFFSHSRIQWHNDRPRPAGAMLGGAVCRARTSRAKRVMRCASARAAIAWPTRLFGLTGRSNTPTCAPAVSASNTIEALSGVTHTVPQRANWSGSQSGEVAV